MKSFNLKVQMLDAGMTMFDSESGFGDTLGQVKAEMEVYGKVFKACDLDGTKLPESTGDYDLFLDWSTPWRIRYISCLVESAGEHVVNGKTVQRYAATFKEGNRSSSLRGVVMFLFLISFATEALITPGIIYTLQGIIFAGLTAYLWILPSSKAQNVIKKLMNRLSHNSL